MTCSTETRPAPLVIRVPPPRRPPYRGVGIGMAVVLAFAAFIITINAFTGDHRTAPFAIALACIGAFFIPAIILMDRRYARRRRTLIEAIAGRAPHEVGTRLAEAWESTGECPSLDETVLKLRCIQEGEDRAIVVSLGAIEVPDPDDVRTEPEIIPTTSMLGRVRLFIPVAGAMLAVWAMQTVGIIPRSIRLRVGFSWIAIGVIAAIIWMWRSLIRPSYIRIAPGVLQVLEFGMRSRTPTVRSYPMEAGTLVVVSGLGERMTLTFLRGGQRNIISIGKMPKPEQQLQRIWPALLSTAPTPPLSDEELLG